MGFVKAFRISDLKELTMPVTKVYGVIWLAAFICFAAVAVMLLFRYHYWWLVGLIAVILSQILIIFFWKDAKYGTIMNILLLLFYFMGFGN